jgi:ribose transport system permease protein
MTESKAKPALDKSSLAVWLNRLGPLLALFAAYIGFAMVAPESFHSLKNIELIIRQTSIVAVAALGMTLVIITSGIDLSIGSLVALVTVVIAYMLQHGANPLLAAAAGLATGMVCGAFNGLLITRLKVVPFIVTLGTLLIFRGAAKGFSNEQKIDAPLSWLNDMLAALRPEQVWMIVPAGVWVLVALAVLTALVLNYTRFGLHVFAIGSNEQAARLCGINIDRVKLLVYSLSGLMAGVAGLLQFSRLTVGDPTVAAGLELDVIASVVIGGGSLSGGEGSILGTLVGALIMTVVRSGCSQLGLSNWIQEIVTGVIIVLAVIVDRLRHRQRQRN